MSFIDGILFLDEYNPEPNQFVHINNNTIKQQLMSHRMVVGGDSYPGSVVVRTDAVSHHS